MNENNNIDDFFRDGISGFKIEPSEQVWQSVKSGFFGKKGFAYYKWYYVSAAILLFLLTAGGIWYYNNNSLTDESFPKEVVNQLNEVEQPTANEIQTGITEEIRQMGIINDNITVNANKDDNNFTNEILVADTKNASRPNSTGNASDQNQIANTSLQYTTQNKPVINFYSKEAGYLKSDFDLSSASSGILSLDARSIKLDYSPVAKMIDPEKVTGMSNYLEKQRKSHLYTGASFTAGMVYYPSTKDQFTWSADLTFGLTAGKFYFESGVSYQDMKERGIYAIELKSYDSVGYFNEVESFEINPQNPEEIIYNTKEVTVYDSLNHYTHTTPYFKYKYINIPISIGFKFFNKDKFTASVSTGVSLSMLIEKDIPESDYYDPEYTVVRIRNMTPERVDWNMIWMMSIRLNYKLYKSLSVSAELVFTKYINSIYNTDLGYTDVKPYTMGLRLGIYYGF